MIQSTITQECCIDVGIVENYFIIGLLFNVFVLIFCNDERFLKDKLLLIFSTIGIVTAWPIFMILGLYVSLKCIYKK